MKKRTMKRTMKKKRKIKSEKSTQILTVSKNN